MGKEKNQLGKGMFVHAITVKKYTKSIRTTFLCHPVLAAHSLKLKFHFVLCYYVTPSLALEVKSETENLETSCASLLTKMQCLMQCRHHAIASGARLFWTTGTSRRGQQHREQPQCQKTQHMQKQVQVQKHLDAWPEFKQQEAESDVTHHNTCCDHCGYIIHGLHWSRVYKVFSNTASY